MKTSWIKGTLIVLLTFALGFKTDDVIEMRWDMNGREQSDFLSTRNIRYTVDKGTRAKIGSIVNFKSGNSGLHVEILSGPHKGDKVWIFHNAKSKNGPGMKLYESEDAGPDSKPARDLASAKSLETTTKHEVIKAAGAEGDKEISKANLDALDEKAKPKKLTKAEFDALNKQMEKGQEAVKKVGAGCDNCPLVGVYSAGDVAKMDAPFIQEPKNPENNVGVRGVADAILTEPRCGPIVISAEQCREIVKNHPVPLNYHQFTYKGDKEASAYMITDRKFDPKTGDINKAGRDWIFKFEGQALQDAHFQVTDDESTDSLYFVFPRTSLPHVREVDGRLIATLPTGETATYDATTKKLINGVLKESSAKGTGNVAYTGSGLVIRLDSEKEGGKTLDPRRSKNALVMKDGNACKVPVADLFPDQSETSALHFKYKKDTPLKEYLKKACGKDFNF